VRATFFVLGWIAESDSGQPPASYPVGNEPRLTATGIAKCNEMSRGEFRIDMRRSIDVLSNRRSCTAGFRDGKPDRPWR
jgi:hypothetical protein